MAKDLTAVRAELPLDSRGNAMQLCLAESVEKYSLTTTATTEIPVPPDASEAVVWATTSGGVSDSAFLFGGARAGAPATLVAVPSGTKFSISCVGAPALYAKATGSAADLYVRWRRRDN